MANKKRRDTNIELLRIVLMVFIVLSHILIHGYHSFSYPSFSIGDSPLLFLVTLCILFPVNCFVFISGYYEIKFNGYKTLSFIIQVLSYSLITFIVGLFFLKTCTIKELPHHLFPISTSLYWFFTNYFLLMLIAPFINKGCDVLAKKHFVAILILMYLISVSFIDIINREWSPFACFLFLYILGRFMRRFPINAVIQHPIAVFLFCLTIQLILGTVAIIKTEWSQAIISRIYLYSSPINILLAISCFFIFKQLNIHYNKCINLISSGVLAAYLFTDSLPVRKWINSFVIDICEVPSRIILLAEFIICSLCIVILLSIFETLVLSIIRKPLSKICYHYTNMVINRI